MQVLETKHKTLYLAANTNTSFQKLNTLITKAQNMPLQYYQWDLFTSVQVEAGQYGLESVSWRMAIPQLLLQNH